MVQKSIIIFGIITLAICLTLFLLSIFILPNNVEYKSTDKVTNSNLSDSLYDVINNSYFYQCFGYAFEIYTGLDCDKYLNANINNESVKYFNNQCYTPDGNKLSTCPEYDSDDVIKFCKFFKNPNFCNVYGY